MSLQRRVVVRDSFGGEIEKWFDVEDVWAGVNQTGTSERFENNAARKVPLRNATFTIGWRADVSETSRVVYDGFPWDIKGIAEIGYRRGLTVYCQTDVSRTT